jgi:hypothetical protein
MEIICGMETLHVVYICITYVILTRQKLQLQSPFSL